VANPESRVNASRTFTGKKKKGGARGHPFLVLTGKTADRPPSRRSKRGRNGKIEDISRSTYTSPEREKKKGGPGSFGTVPAEEGGG